MFASNLKKRVEIFIIVDHFRVFYFQKIEILSAEEAANLYYAGQKYKSKDTIDLVDSYATQTCNKETAQLYYRCARIFGNPELEQLCLRAYHQDILKSIQYINKYGAPDYTATAESDKTSGIDTAKSLLKFGIDIVKSEAKLYQEMESEVEKIRDNNNLNSRVEQSLGIIVYLNSKVKQIISLIVPSPNQIWIRNEKTKN